jgi:hypothetical protein
MPTGIVVPPVTTPWEFKCPPTTIVPLALAGIVGFVEPIFKLSAVWPLKLEEPDAFVELVTIRLTGALVGVVPAARAASGNDCAVDIAATAAIKMALRCLLNEGFRLFIRIAHSVE